MKNIIIELRNYEGNQFRSGYRRLTEVNGNGDNLVSDITGMNPVDFIEVTLNEVVKSILASGGAAEDIMINLPDEIILSAGLKTTLADKHAADPIVSSVTLT
jgi:hypothetical protein